MATNRGVTIRLEEKGDFSKTFKFLKGLKEKSWKKSLDTYGRQGVEALRAVTPKDTGLTANSWHYEIIDFDDNVTIRWYNTNVKKGWYNVALMIQYGHGTGTGGWVQGVDYINPALSPIFEKMLRDIWVEVKNS